MLEPIYRLLFGRIDEKLPRRLHPKQIRPKLFLALARDQVKISYEVYKANNLGDMNTILYEKLAPGKPDSS